MTDEDIDQLVVKTMAQIMRHVSHEDGEVLLGHPAFDVLRDTLKQLREERDQLIEQIALRQPSAVERDMQHIMQINNSLKEDVERLRDLLAFNHIDPDAIVASAKGADRRRNKKPRPSVRE